MLFLSHSEGFPGDYYKSGVIICSYRNLKGFLLTRSRWFNIVEKLGFGYLGITHYKADCITHLMRFRIQYSRYTGRRTWIQLEGLT